MVSNIQSTYDGNTISINFDKESNSVRIKIDEEMDMSISYIHLRKNQLKDLIDILNLEMEVFLNANMDN